MNFVFDIFRQIVLDMAYRPPYQVNSFMVVDQIPDIMHPSFGATYEDYLAGFFWSRTWVYQRAAPDKICAEFPALFIEARETLFDPQCDETGKTTFYLVLVDKITCEGCPPEIKRNGLSVKDYLLTSMRAILREFFSYSLYDTDNGLSWMSEGRADLLGETIIEEQIISMTAANEVEISDWGNYANMRGVMAKINIEYCKTFDVPFDYQNPVIEPLANIPCRC